LSKHCKENNIFLAVTSSSGCNK